MVDTLPLALIAISALNAVFASRILSNINESVLIILQHTGTVGTELKSPAISTFASGHRARIESTDAHTLSATTLRNGLLYTSPPYLLG